MPETDSRPANDSSSCGCGCGTPQRSAFVQIGSRAAQSPAREAAGSHRIEQAAIPAGSFEMGDSSGDRNPADGEVPLHRVSLSAFSIDATTVTNDAFAAFVDATGYRTEAEQFGYSAVFHLAVTAPESDILGVPPQTPWWRGVRDAEWRRPGGNGSTIDGRGDHPRTNTAEDGWETTAPVRSYTPNGFGLWQPVGNVWEWCADRFDPTYYGSSPETNPVGPESGDSRVLRGGSYLCHISYCNRYRNSARSQNTPDSSMGNAGFRTVAL